MFAQIKKTRLTDGSFVYGVCIGYDGIVSAELDAYSEAHALALMDAIKANTAVSVIVSYTGDFQS